MFSADAGMITDTKPETTTTVTSTKDAESSNTPDAAETEEGELLPSSTSTIMTISGMVPSKRPEIDQCTADKCDRRLRCMVGDKGKKPVSKACPGGVCVMRMSYGRRREQKKRRGVSGYKEGLEHRTYHCQNLTAYPASAVNFCSDVEVQYPHLRIYRAKFAIYVKYCCQTHECNKDFDTIIMLPTYQTQNENRDQIYFDYAIIYTELIVVAAVALWPLVILLQDRKEERKLYAMLNAPMEKYVIEMALAPAMKTTKVSKTVTGQLSFWDLCRELTNMELRIRKPCVTIKPGSLPFYHKFEHVAGGNGHKLVKVERVKMPGYESFILTQLVEHGPYMYDWKPFEMVTLFSQAADIFEGEPTMLTLRAPITIIGDIRGQYQDLHRWLCIAGFPPRQKVLFLGGVIDSDEPGSLDCLAFIAAMKVRFPHDVFYIRGIGETLPIRFQPRFRKRNDFAIQSAATRLCNNLPLAARISNQILAVHSGLSHELSNYECIEAVKRPFTLADMPSLAKQLIFSEPTLLIDMYRCGTELSSAKFGLAAVNRVCRDMGVKLIVRARNPLKDGICWLGRRQRLISLWSAPAKETSKGAVISIHANFLIHVYTLERQKEKKMK